MSEETPKPAIPDSSAPSGSPEKKAYNRMKAKESRDRRKPAPDPTFTGTVHGWDKNLRNLQTQDLKRFWCYRDRHNQVIRMLEELQDVHLLASGALRAEDCVDPEIVLRDISQDAQAHGVANYRLIESAFPTWPKVVVYDRSVAMEKETHNFDGDVTAEIYQQTGLMLKLPVDSPRQAQELAEKLKVTK